MTIGGTSSPSPSEKRGATSSLGASADVATIAGLGAIALTCLALFGVLPSVFAAASAIVVGGALMVEALFISGSCAAKIHQDTVEKTNSAMPGESTSAQVVSGTAGVVLGGLALVGVHSWTLLSVAAVIFGGALLSSGAVRAELVHDGVAAAIELPSSDVGLLQASRLSGGVMALAGFAAFALGLLAWSENGAANGLVLIALLVAGAGVVFGGAALPARFVQFLQ